MRSKNKKRKPPRWKTKLGLPDLDNAKAAVLASWLISKKLAERGGIETPVGEWEVRGW